MLGGFKKVGSGLDKIKDPPFKIYENSGQIELQFTVDSSMSGYISFKIFVQDVQDPWGNGKQVFFLFSFLMILSQMYLQNSHRIAE